MSETNGFGFERTPESENLGGRSPTFVSLHSLSATHYFGMVDK
jgi:hypothetical protein